MINVRHVCSQRRDASYILNELFERAAIGSLPWFRAPINLSLFNNLFINLLHHNVCPATTFGTGKGVCWAMKHIVDASERTVFNTMPIREKEDVTGL